MNCCNNFDKQEANKNKKDFILNKYFALKRGISHHLLPSQGILFYQRDTSELKYLAHQKYGLQYINKMASEIMSKCDGTSTLMQILDQVETLNMGEREVIDTVVDFISEAVKRGFVEYYEKPNPQNMHITGSRSYYIPIHMMLELTYNCNLRCKHCYNNSGLRKYNNLPLESLQEIITDLASNGVKGVELTGGEPLAYPEFKKIFQTCVNKFETVALLTNGYALNEEMAELIGHYKHKVLVQIDLDGSTPDNHDYIRGVPGSFVKAKNAISLLAKREVKTRAAMSVIPGSIYDIENTLVLAKKLGATWFLYSLVQEIGRGKDLQSVFSQDYRDYFNNLQQTFIEKYNGFVLIVPKSEIEKFKRIGNCGAGYRSCVMDPYGNVRPCPLLPNEYITLGNLNNNTVNEVFSNPKVKYLAHLRAPELEVCGNCTEIYDCNYCITRTIYKQTTNNLCKWAKENQIDKWYQFEQFDNNAGKCTRINYESFN